MSGSGETEFEKSRDGLKERPFRFPWRFFNRANRYSSEMGWVVFGQAGLAAGYVLAIKLISAVLDVEEFGRFSLGLTLINLVQLTLFTPLAQGLMRYWSVSVQQGNMAAFQGVSGKWMLRLVFGSILGAIALMAGAMALHQDGWVIVIGLSILSGALGGCVNGDVFVMNADRSRKAAAWFNVFFACLRPGLGFALAIGFWKRAEAVLLGYFLVSLVMAPVSRGFLRGWMAKSAEKPAEPEPAHQNLSNQIFAFSWPFLPLGIFSWIQQSSDRWALQAMFGAEAVGRFAVVSQMAFYPMVFLSGILQLFFMPIAYGKAQAHPGARGAAFPVLIWLVGAFLLLALVVVGFLGLFQEELVVLVSRSAYTGYHVYLVGMGVAWALYYLGVVLSGFGLVAERSRVYLPAGFASAIVAAVGCFLGAFLLGPRGVVAALWISGGMYAAWNGWTAYRIVSGIRKAHPSGSC
ncbi:lipopolysaccharide biosynthesis protein [Desulfatirhabdium butyrativorans]|uniref:lipopolysaccharide biosynthesis protein n=1 Tax=Desulfatirhabdium butyrativorans TaxID=340467 RepID=UPI000423B603|nr:hypothetical protein [Desulfatirhabdium butyrativorans]